MTRLQRIVLLASLGAALVTVLFPAWSYERAGPPAPSFISYEASVAYDTHRPPTRRWLFSGTSGQYGYTYPGDGGVRGTMTGAWRGEPDWSATLPLTGIVLLVGAIAFVLTGFSERRRAALYLLPIALLVACRKPEQAPTVLPATPPPALAPLRPPKRIVPVDSFFTVPLGIAKADFLRRLKRTYGVYCYSDTDCDGGHLGQIPARMWTLSVADGKVWRVKVSLEASLEVSTEDLWSAYVERVQRITNQGAELKREIRNGGVVHTAYVYEAPLYTFTVAREGYSWLGVEIEMEGYWQAQQRERDREKASSEAEARRLVGGGS